MRCAARCAAASAIAVEVGLKFLGRIFRYIFWVVVTAAIAWVARKIIQSGTPVSSGSQRGPVRVEPARVPKELFRDPVCGAYVAGNISHSLAVGSETLHFCSRGCVDQYRAPEKLGAGT